MDAFLSWLVATAVMSAVVIAGMYAMQFLYKGLGGLFGWLLDETVRAPAEINPSNQFLNVIRSRSCYPVLRGAHGFLTVAAVIGTGILWIVLLANSANAAAAAYATFTCAAVIVAVFLEYGLFRLIVDAVDVLIDTGRRAAGERGDAGG